MAESSKSSQLLVCLNALLAIVALVALVAVGPRVYGQLHFQLNDPRGGDSMWPMTFQGILIIASILAPLAACSVLFNHSSTRFLRLTSAITIVLLVASWIYSAVLLQRDYRSFTGPSDLTYPPVSEMQILDRMAGFDGLPFMLTAIAFLSVAVVTGRGPVSLFGQFAQKRKKGK